VEIGIRWPVDWDAVIEPAGQHGLTGFVYAGLTAHGKDLVPVYYPEDKDLVSAKLLGKEIQTLAPEEMLMHLCIHATSHCWDRLELICSVVRLANRGQVSRWDRVLVRARALKCRRMVLPGLLLARKCVDIRLDPVVQSAIAQDPGLEKLAEDIKEWTLYPLPPRLTPLYRIIRPIRLLSRVVIKRGVCVIVVIGEGGGKTAWPCSPYLFLHILTSFGG
jgi:hypothetical protein